MAEAEATIMSNSADIIEMLEKESFTQEITSKLMKHQVLEELRIGKLSKEEAAELLRLVLSEQHYVCNSDLRSLKASCEKWSDIEGYKSFLTFFRDGEDFALTEHGKMWRMLGQEPESLDHHQPHHKCQAYPGQFCLMLLQHYPMVAACAFSVNFPAWGEMCGILRDSLVEHYAYKKEDLGFLDFFATPISNLPEMVVLEPLASYHKDQVFQSAREHGHDVPYPILKRCVRLLQEYEVLFWDGIWDQFQRFRSRQNEAGKCLIC